jgi:hypothetical protein
MLPDFFQFFKSSFMKHYKLTGLLTALVLIISCFLPWAFYPDLNKSFTGFFSEKNNYGKPGIFFVFIALFSIVLILSDKVWAKRTHVLISALNIGYMITKYIQFTSCYYGTCPQKEIGIYLVVASSLMMLIVALFPNVKLVSDEEENS